MPNGFPELVYEDRREDQLNLGPNAMSIDLLRAVYRNPSIPLPARMRAAIAALPVEVPKLAVTALVTENDIATLLERRIKRYEEMKLIENGNQPPPQQIEQPTIEHQPQMIETSRPLSRTSDRRFRRM
jgi:hypothetical protein